MSTSTSSICTVPFQCSCSKSHSQQWPISQAKNLLCSYRLNQLRWYHRSRDLKVLATHLTRVTQTAERHRWSAFSQRTSSRCCSAAGAVCSDSSGPFSPVLGTRKKRNMLRCSLWMGILNFVLGCLMCPIIIVFLGWYALIMMCSFLLLKY